MTAYWFLFTALFAGILHVNCDTHPASPDERLEDASALLGALFGFKPCLDENCESYVPAVPEADGSVYEPQGPETTDSEYMEENPRVHCILLKPSAVNTFGLIESRHPGISDIKYRVLEELIDHMYPFATLNLENCQPAMKLVDLIILAGNSLKTQYVLQGGENCTYRGSKDKEGLVPDYEVTEMPCKHESSEYATGSSICPGSTLKPEDETPSIPETYPGEKPVTEKPVQKLCPDGVTTEQPCQPAVDIVTEEYLNTPDIEIIAEDEADIPYVGSMRGIPGVHYPNYTDIPITSFTCADKKCIPGFYADLETSCQVFHVCYEHRRESFLCPVGTTFNQPILACDYWYSSNCSLAPQYYDVNEKNELKEEKIDMEVEELLTLIAENEKSEETNSQQSESDLDEITQFFPVKAVVTDIKPEGKVPIKHAIEAVEEVASEIVDEMATKVTKLVSSSRDIIKSIPEPSRQKPIYKSPRPELYQIFKKPMKMEELLAGVVVPLTKAKLAAIPVSKVTALKTAVPVAGLAAKAKVALPVAGLAAKAKVALPVAGFAAKAKVAMPVAAAKAKFVTKAAAAPLLAKAKLATVPAAKIAIAAPVAKAKIVAVPAIKVAAAKAAVPVVAKVAVKSSIPALKAKMVASAVPLAKAKIVPLVKSKVAKGASAQLLKAKMLALPLAKSKLAGPLPLAKVKLAKAAAISPLTKKALALGYMKLLKAKKIALMG